MGYNYKKHKQYKVHDNLIKYKLTINLNLTVNIIAEYFGN